MKKILALILTFSIFLGFAFAQETQAVKLDETESNEKYLGFIRDMKAGAFFNFEPAAGDLYEFVFSTIGGGAAFEAGIPLPVFSENSIIHGLFDNFGASFRMAFDGGIMKNTSVDSIFSMRYTAGVFTRIPLPGNMFSIVPEINYGIALNLPKVSGAGSQYVKKVYADQILQVGTGVRFTHPAMLNEKLELEFTPTYSFSPESGSSVHYIGFRFGVLYKFADKRKVSSASNESQNSISEEETSEAEHIELTPELVQKKDGLNTRAEALRLEFEELAQDAEDNNLKKLAKKYKDYEKQVEKILEEISHIYSEESLTAVEEKLKALEEKIGNLEEIEEEAEVELDMAVTAMAAKTGHAALIHHPDGSYTIAIPPITFEANSTGLIISNENIKSLDTIIDVLKTDERVMGMTVSVFGYINPDSKSENWSDEEKNLAKGRAQSIATYLLAKGCEQRIDSHEGKGYTSNAEFNRRVEFLVHN